VKSGLLKYGRKIMYCTLGRINKYLIILNQCRFKFTPPKQSILFVIFMTKFFCKVTKLKKIFLWTLLSNAEVKNRLTFRTFAFALSRSRAPCFFALFEFALVLRASLIYALVISFSCVYKRPGQDSLNRKARTEQAEQDRQNRTGRTGQAEQDRQNRTGRTGQAEQDRQKKTAMTAQRGQDMSNRTGRTGQTVQNRQNRTARTGQLLKNRARTGQTEQDCHERTGRTRRPGQDSQDMTSRPGKAGTWQAEQDRQTGRKG
jgi:hypothetical protein